MEIPPMPPIKLGGSPPPPPSVILELNFTKTMADEPRWVIVKGMSDSDTINRVYGTYTEKQADWMLQEFASDSFARWTKIQLSAGPQ